LYRIYTKCRINDRSHPDRAEEDIDHPVTSILDSIEKRWLKLEQDLFIACFFLNPFINPALRNSNNLTVAVLMGIIKRLYMRVFDTSECPNDLMSQVYNYHTREGVFSDAKWPISELKESLKELVRNSSLRCEQILNTFNQDGSNDPIRVWKILDRQNPLVNLAILILSFVPNSASTERLFSSMGDIKTKKRNRLGVQKLRDCALVKGEIQRLNAAEGTARIRLKCKLGSATPSIADIDKSGSRVEDEDIVQAAERDAADGLGESSTDSDHQENRKNIIRCKQMQSI
jgi:hypothetical protein